MYGGRGFRGFVLMLIGKMEILYTFYQFQDTIKVIRRYEGWYYIQFYSYYIILYFESDWSRSRPLPSTTFKDIARQFISVNDRRLHYFGKI